MSVQLIDARSYRVRHIAPTDVWASEGATATVLGLTYGFTELPLEHSPTSAGLVEGSYTGRLGDSGEFSLSFPNGSAAKGFLWRERFSADRCREFVEIYRDDVLEFVGNIQRVEIDRGVVTVSGTDAWALLRRAYERDRAWTASPADIVRHYTKVSVPRLLDDFPGSSLDAGWTVSGTATVANGTVTVVDTGAPPFAALTQDFGVNLGDDWRVLVVGRILGNGRLSIRLITDVAGATIHAQVFAEKSATAQAVIGMFTTGNTYTAQKNVTLTEPTTFQLQRQGRWISAYVNGALVGFLPASTQNHDTIQIIGNAPPQDFELYSVQVTETVDFLSTGSDQGDIVLPGDLPTGGLRGRYFNNADLQGLSSANRNAIVMNPSREHYAERLDPVVDTIAGSTVIPMQPGNSGDYFAVRWFGAVYLRFDLGNYAIQTTSVADGVRLWVGRTAWGDQVIDDWTTSAGTNTETLTAADFDNAAGWYPIVLELFCDTNTPTIALEFDPPSAYTDPGGTSIPNSMDTIPATSLSPLGCYDNRVQGQAHFDLVQGVAQQFGYQIICEPMQLESGEFPGRLVPRLRVGSDTDVILEVEDDDAHEPLFAPGVTFDGSEQTTSLIGTGAGLPDGSSQVTSEVTDITSLGSALFDMQTWVDAADVAFPDLLAARLNAELALRATPWEEVRGTPRAQDRLADTWPITGVYGAMRWNAGDGVRIRVPEISVEDTEPRQLLQVTRAFAADGRTATQVAFRQRPRSAARSVRGRVQAALQSQRSYQRQKVTLSSSLVVETISAGSFGANFGEILLLPQDDVVRAVLRIANNTAAQTLGVEINSVDRTAALGGTWSTEPVEIDFIAYATQASSTDNRLYMRLQNTGGSPTVADWIFFVEVLR